MFGILETVKIVKKHKVIGRGGKKGKSSGRGRGGQLSRTGSRSEIGVFFEGGQMSYFRRLPRRGFNSLNKIEFEIVKLKDIAEKCENVQDIGFSELVAANLVKHDCNRPVKVLANGGIDRKINLTVNAVSKATRDIIEKAGGAVFLI